MALQSRVSSQLVTSTMLQESQRTIWSLLRRITCGRATVHYFHQVDDPYSLLCGTVLLDFAKLYEIRVAVHLVGPPKPDGAPDLERLKDWSRRDCNRLAASLHIRAPVFEKQPTDERVVLANAILAQSLSTPQALEVAVRISFELWQDRSLSEEPSPPSRALSGPAAIDAGERLRRQYGHYLSAMLFFEGEWYWGIDRLHHLEQRLVAWGLRREGDPTSPPLQPQPVSPSSVLPVWQPLFPPPPLQYLSLASLREARDPARAPPVLRFFCSLRSPYTYLAAAAVQQLASHYALPLQLCYVLPMVMRGLPVPLAKRLYILRDTKREAGRAGLPFGCIVDPVGRPVERGLALLQCAVREGCGPAMLESFLRGVFAEGVDAGSDDGLLALARRAGLSLRSYAPAPTTSSAARPTSLASTETGQLTSSFEQLDMDTMQRALADPVLDREWRAAAETHAQALLGLGLWGVPAFQVAGRPGLWGQDRLWMLEQDILQALQ